MKVREQRETREREEKTRKENDEKRRRLEIVNWGNKVLKILKELKDQPDTSGTATNDKVLSWVGIWSFLAKIESDSTGTKTGPTASKVIWSSLQEMEEALVGSFNPAAPDSICPVGPVDGIPGPDGASTGITLDRVDEGVVPPLIQMIDRCYINNTSDTLPRHDSHYTFSRLYSDRNVEREKAYQQAERERNAKSIMTSTITIEGKKTTKGKVLADLSSGT